MLEAKMAHASGCRATEITTLAIEADSSVRDMTPEEVRRVTEIFRTRGHANI
jgi:hypothetical protein